MRLLAAARKARVLTVPARDLLRNRSLETALFMLLLTTFLAVLFEDAILRRTINIGPDTELAFRHAHSDASAGGSSVAVADESRPHNWSCELRAKYAYPFCAYEWVFKSATEGAGLDLSRLDRVSISISYEGQAKSVRLHLKNQDPRYSKAGVVNPDKFNTVEVPLQPGQQTIQINVDAFAVPDWWILENHIPTGLSHPQFDNIVGAEISTGTGAPVGTHKFHVKEITFRHRLLSTQEWYLIIAAGWLALVTFFMISFRREVKARREAEKRAETYARHDPMTGFFNRRAFGHQLDADLASRDEQTEAAVFLVEVDHLTSVSDVYGHDAGESLLIEMALRIRTVLGAHALIGRVRDDEFACLVEGAPDVLREHAVELLQSLNRPFKRGGRTFNAWATIGIAGFPQHGTNYGQLLRAADVALRDGQRSGGASYRFFDPAQSTEAPDKLREEEQSPASETHGLPVFLSAAATEILVKENFRIASCWSSSAAVVINMSADQLQDEWAAERIIAVMGGGGFELSNLVLKLKETCYLAASSTAIRNLDSLQKAGAKISLSEVTKASFGVFSNITFDHVELSDDFLNSQFSAARKKQSGSSKALTEVSRVGRPPQKNQALSASG